MSQIKMIYVPNTTFITFNLIVEGKTASEISVIRKMSEKTIQNHISTLIFKGALIFETCNKVIITANVSPKLKTVKVKKVKKSKKVIKHVEVIDPNDWEDNMPLDKAKTILSHEEFSIYEKWFNTKNNLSLDQLKFYIKNHIIRQLSTFDISKEMVDNVKVILDSGVSKQTDIYATLKAKGQPCMSFRKLVIIRSKIDS